MADQTDRTNDGAASPQQEPVETAAPIDAVSVPWTWLPTVDGALRRSEVLSVHIERQDGNFKNQATSMWTVHVRTSIEAEPIRLRPVFFDGAELRWWMDRVFPGACFEILPPDLVPDETEHVEPEGVLLATRWVGTPVPGPGGRLGSQLRGIGDGMIRGDSYVPPQGYRPPPGVHVAI